MQGRQAACREPRGSLRQRTVRVLRAEGWGRAWPAKGGGAAWEAGFSAFECGGWGRHVPAAKTENLGGGTVRTGSHWLPGHHGSQIPGPAPNQLPDEGTLQPGRGGGSGRRTPPDLILPQSSLQPVPCAPEKARGLPWSRHGLWAQLERSPNESKGPKPVSFPPGKYGFASEEGREGVWGSSPGDERRPCSE